MLFSWLADKITVAVSEITSSSSWGLSYDWFTLQTVSSFSFGVPRVSPQSDLCLRASEDHWPLGWDQALTKLFQKESSKFLAIHRHV